MSNMQRLDESAGNEGGAPPQGVREPAHLPHDGVRYRPDWPFLYYQERSEGKVKTYLNKAPHKSKYQQAEAVGFAEF